jgi:hypothetical protein
MIMLLREHQVPSAFKRHMEDGAFIAAPFWGEGSAHMLGLDGKKHIKILCNLQSGACNPFVIESIVKIPNVQVRSNPRLHAKIYGADKCVLIGSSNPSKGGLSVTGEHKGSLIEANVFTDDVRVVADSKKLFQAIWISKETREVTLNSAVLSAAKRKWTERQFNGRGESIDLFSACRNSPKAFRSVYIAGYDDDLSDVAEKRLRLFKRSARVESDVLGAGDFRKVWGYQLGRNLKPGSWVIDFDWSSKKRPIVRGTSQILVPLKVRGEVDLLITAAVGR